MFLNQVCSIILCGSDITVHVMLAFGLKGKEGFVWFFFKCGSSTPMCVLIIALQGNEGSLFVKVEPDGNLTVV